jgi:hypothetical protein
MTSEAYHGPLLRLAWRYLGSGMSKRKTVETLQGLLLAVPEPHDERWQSRFDDVARLVESAETKQEQERESTLTARVEDLVPAPAAEAPPPEPADMLDDLFHGPLGLAVWSVWDLTEADHRGIMAALLTMFGNWIGREFYVAVGADRHVPCLFTLLVGPSGTGRKGTAANIAKLFMREFDSTWEEHNIFYSLNSGQGIVHTVKNLDKSARERQGDGGGVGNGDRRAMFCIAEFGDVLRKAEQTSNTLLDTLRDCWDSGALENNSVTHNARIRGAAVSLLGMTTHEDLIERIDLRELATGTWNRVLMIQVDRSQVLPGNPPTLGGEHVKDAVDELRANVERLRASYLFGCVQGVEKPIKLSPAAAEMAVRLKAAAERGGRSWVDVGNARAYVQTLRVALVYAVADGSRTIEPEHLKAALSLIGHAASGVGSLATGELKDVIAQRILTHMRESPNEALSRTGVSTHVFAKNVAADKLEDAIRLLLKLGLLSEHRVSTKGRPATMYRLI